MSTRLRALYAAAGAEPTRSSPGRGRGTLRAPARPDRTPEDPLRGLFNLLTLALTIYSLLIVLRAIMSWVPLSPGSGAQRLYRNLVAVTEPYLGIFRRRLPAARVGGVGIDWSPMVALLVLYAALLVLGRL